MSVSNILRIILSNAKVFVLAVSILIDGVAGQVYTLIPEDTGSALVELRV